MEDQDTEINKKEGPDPNIKKINVLGRELGEPGGRSWGNRGGRDLEPACRKARSESAGEASA